MCAHANEEGLRFGFKNDSIIKNPKQAVRDNWAAAARSDSDERNDPAHRTSRAREAQPFRTDGDPGRNLRNKLSPAHPGSFLPEIVVQQHVRQRFYVGHNNNSSSALAVENNEIVL